MCAGSVREVTFVHTAIRPNQMRSGSQADKSEPEATKELLVKVLPVFAVQVVTAAVHPIPLTRQVCSRESRSAPGSGLAFC